MKKYRITRVTRNIAMAALLLSASWSCREEEVTPTGELAPVSFTLTVGEGEMDKSEMATSGETGRTMNQSRVAAGELDGSEINRCVMEVYHEGSRVLRREVAVEEGSKSFVIDDFNLVTGQEYDFVFWADCATQDPTSGTFTDEKYNTVMGLTAITTTEHVASATTDAFTATLPGVEVNRTISESVTLTRPFALLTIKASNPGELTTTGPYTIIYKDMPKEFNALTGKVTGWDENYSVKLSAPADGELSSVFVWMESDDAEATMDITVGGKEAPGIPLQRNYRTNVSVKL